MDYGSFTPALVCIAPMVYRGFMVSLVSIYLRNYGYGLDHRVCSWSDFVKNMLVVTWGGWYLNHP
jgi:hypothetical protein